MDQPIEITLQLTPAEAWALAELCKRIGYTEIRALSKDDTEARYVGNAMYRVAVELAAAGVAPR